MPAVAFASQLERELTAVTEQRDRLAEALEMLIPQQPRYCDAYDQGMWDNAKEALAAVKGGSDE